MSRYPQLTEEYGVHISPEGGWVKGTRSTEIDFSRVSEIISRGRLALTPLHPINVSAREFLRRCNGARSYEGIIDELGRQFNVDRETVLRSLSGFVEEAVKRNHLALLDQPGERPICVTGSDQYFAPLHAQLELTDRCNLACSYCYRSAHVDSADSAEQGTTISYEDVRTIVDTLKAHGVLIMELTGGEPLMNARFADILDYCTSNMNLVCIETNGTAITEKMADRIARSRKVMLSVSLDGATPEMVDEMASRKGTYEQVTAGIRRLAKREVVVRVAMTVLKRNLKEAEATLLLAKELGASSFSLGPPVPMGRAALNKHELIPDEEMHQFHVLMMDLFKRHTSFIATTAPATTEYHEKVAGNCGAGYRSVAIAPNGDVRYCVTSSGPWSVMGNILTDSYDDLFGGPKARFFKRLRWPEKETCGECERFGCCAKCAVRGIDAAIARNWDCAWAKSQGVRQWVPDDGRDGSNAPAPHECRCPREKAGVHGQEGAKSVLVGAGAAGTVKLSE